MRRHHKPAHPPTPLSNSERITRWEQISTHRWRLAQRAFAILAVVNIIAIAKVVDTASTAKMTANHLEAFAHQIANQAKEGTTQKTIAIGDRCQNTDHERKILEHNLPTASLAESTWFEGSYHRCIRLLRQAEGLSHTRYVPTP